MDKALRDHVRDTAIQQDNGNWTFEGKDRHSWGEESRHLKAAAARWDNDNYMDGYYDARIIVATLLLLDKGERHMLTEERGLSY